MEVVNGDYGGGWSLGWVGRRWGVCEMTREEGEGRGRGRLDLFVGSSGPIATPKGINAP